MTKTQEDRLSDLNRIEAAAFDGTVIVTGGYGGIGAEAVRAMHQSHPRALILVAGRNETKARAFAASLPPNVASARLDLAALGDVDEFAEDIGRRVASGAMPRITALICNAGTQAAPGEMVITEDGFEATFAVNHLAHMRLTLCLLPQFADRARLIVVSSGTHDPAKMEGRFNKPVMRSAAELADPNQLATKQTNSIVRYSTSKLCNLLFAYEVARRADELLPGKRIDVLTYDPGGVPGSDLLRGMNPLAKRVLTAPWLMRLLGVAIRTPSEAGEHLAALLERDAGEKPSYWQGPCRSHSSDASHDADSARSLWDGSEALLERRISATSAK